MKKKKNFTAEEIIKEHFETLLKNDPVRNAELDQPNSVDLPLELIKKTKKNGKKENEKNDIIAEEC